MKKFSSLLSLILIICLIVNSCGRKEYTEAGINEIIEEWDKLLETANGERFDWGSPKAFSYFTAYFSGDEMIFINEDYRYRSSAEAFNRYYFKDGKCIYFIGKSLFYKKDENGKDYKELLDLTMYIDPDGNVIAYDKTRNMQRVALEDEDAEGVIKHAAELYEIVKKRKTVSKK